MELMEELGSTLDKPALSLSTADIYDIAACLGQELEFLVDQCGAAALTKLVSKVVRVLEMLEVLVEQKELSSEHKQLEMEVRRLQREREERLEKEKMKEKDLEQVEDMWRAEVEKLRSQVAELQAQNVSLRTSLSVSLSEAQHKECVQQSEGTEPELIFKLKETVEQQRDEINTKQHIITQKNEHIETLHMQQHRMMKINQDLRRRLSVVEVWDGLVQQRAEVDALSQDTQQELGSVKNRLRREKTSCSARLLIHHPPAPRPATTAAMMKLEPPAGADGTQDPVLLECGTLQKFLPEVLDPAHDPTLLLTHTEEEMIAGESRSAEDDTPLPLWEVLCRNEAAEDGYCMSSPSMPHFTLQELQDVLHERNELKAQVFLLQEELAYYNSEEELDLELTVVGAGPSTPPPSSSSSATQCKTPPESGIKKLLFTAIMPMVAAGLISDDPTLQPIRRLISVI